MDRTEHIRRALVIDLALLVGLTVASVLTVWGVQELQDPTVGWAVVAVGAIAWTALRDSHVRSTGEAPASMALFAAVTSALALVGGLLAFVGCAALLLGGPTGSEPSLGGALAHAGIALLSYGMLCRRTGLHGRTGETAREAF